MKWTYEDPVLALIKSMSKDIKLHVKAIINLEQSKIYQMLKKCSLKMYAQEHIFLITKNWKER